ncbi:adenosylcobalamin-dependent ribonucleoside-diphosphate reductase [Acidocella sp.]|uniref:adenosylcobalamin-dependent ribonucleoside-diphosphate reductase n=1 Tax=Acidocella sp. TaxID=50710 RepID=UPI00262657D0|nr:adenosylcobalamin-dependent ribonucleoside-diphosphate reductase [Acidocella sp.]
MDIQADFHASKPSVLETMAPISAQIWDAKYRLKDDAGKPVDSSVEDMWRRVARALAEVEAEPTKWEGPFYEALENFRFIPAGRILSGAGTARRVTLFNCFVMGDIEDDLGQIFMHLREAALTMQQGGGIGYDFSSLRPKGAPVRGVGADASGPLSFMDVWDSMCRTIMSAGARRGAMMATMRCDHPDIIEFIAAKREKERLRNFNLSVLVTDDFMRAVELDTTWDLKFDGHVYRSMRARELWDLITRATYEYAEPGVIFIDRINARNNLYYCETIHATNPCGEQPLPPYGACLLGSINLARLVREPFTAAAGIDEAELAKLVGTAIRMMDNTIDASGFPLEQQRKEADAKRRIGLGMTGLADALMMCGLRYGSVEAATQATAWAAQVERAAYLASANLASEKGAFPLYDRSKYLTGETVGALDEDVRDAISQHGIRNALLTSIAPTGTISLVADNVSSGVEPVFALAYTRKVLQRDGTRREEEVSDYALRLWRTKFGEAAALPDYFVTAQDLSPAEHVRMQAAVQRHVDSAISKTVNVPKDISFEAFQEVYLDAYRSGCKGCTTYRPNEVTGSVLEVSAPTAETHEAHKSREDEHGPELLVRADRLLGATYKLRWPDSEHAMYVTINDIEQDGVRRPFEIFVNSKNLEHYAWVVALTRMISAVFRRGGEVAFVAEELKQVFDPRGGQWAQGRYVPSLVAAIGDVIERHMIETGFLVLENDRLPTYRKKTQPDASPLGSICPKCSQPGLVREAGCLSCLQCGWSKCG